MFTPHGNYRVQLFGGQCWMIDNLREPPTKFGFDSLNRGWYNLQEPFKGNQGFYGFYSEEKEYEPFWAHRADSSGEGSLYQWSAAMNGSNALNNRGVCPEGWHIPSDADWQYLEDVLFPFKENTSFNQRSIAEGKDTLAHVDRFHGNNDYKAFEAFPGGFRSVNGRFYQMGSHGYFWSSTQASETSAYYRACSSASNDLILVAVDKLTLFRLAALRTNDYNRNPDLPHGRQEYQVLFNENYNLSAVVTPLWRQIYPALPTKIHVNNGINPKKLFFESLQLLEQPQHGLFFGSGISP